MFSIPADATGAEAQTPIVASRGDWKRGGHLDALSKACYEVGSSRPYTVYIMVYTKRTPQRLSMSIVNGFIDRPPDPTVRTKSFESAAVVAFVGKTHGYGGSGFGFVGIPLNEKFVDFVDRGNTIHVSAQKGTMVYWSGHVQSVGKGGLCLLLGWKTDPVV